jgi:dihydrofolate synthase / folylpolyglutamate synthase
MGKQYSIKKYYRAVDFIESLASLYVDHHISPETRLRYFKDFMRTLGSPQKKYKIIHIGGTAGKGSVSSLIHLALVNAGYKVGLYTSPHTTTTIERIKIDNRYIAAEGFYNILKKIKPKMHDVPVPPNYFGLLVAIAFQYFAEEKCDYVVLETGIGGDLDTTNIVPPPVATIITNVGKDHTDILGKTLIEIAGHKAGLIKRNTEFFTSESNAKVLKLFRNRCKEKKANFTHIEPNGEMFDIVNAKLAQAVVDKLGVKTKITNTMIKKSAKLPCRQEIIQQKPMVMLDGAHNPAKIEALKSYVIKSKKKVKYLIIGVSGNKDWRSILKTITPLAENIILTRFISSRRSTVSPLKMYQYLKKQRPKFKTEVFWDPLEALNSVLKRAKKQDFILITGSMYLTGEVRRHWISEKYILRTRKCFKNGNGNSNH